MTSSPQVIIVMVRNVTQLHLCRGGRGSDTDFPSSPSTSSQNWAAEWNSGWQDQKQSRNSHRSRKQSTDIYWEDIASSGLFLWAFQLIWNFTTEKPVKLYFCNSVGPALQPCTSGVRCNEKKTLWKLCSHVIIYRLSQRVLPMGQGCFKPPSPNFNFCRKPDLIVDFFTTRVNIHVYALFYHPLHPLCVNWRQNISNCSPQQLFGQNFFQYLFSHSLCWFKGQV